MRDALDALLDVEIFGTAWVDWHGRRVDPRLVYIDKASGFTLARGKRVYRPAPVTLDFDPRPR